LFSSLVTGLGPDFTGLPGSRESRLVTLLNPRSYIPRSPRSSYVRLPVELADDLWRMDLLGGVARYPARRGERRRTRAGSMRGTDRDRDRDRDGAGGRGGGRGGDFRQSVVVIRTGSRRIAEVTAGITISIIYTRVDLGSFSCRASGFLPVVWLRTRTHVRAISRPTYAAVDRSIVEHHKTLYTGSSPRASAHAHMRTCGRYVSYNG